MKFAYILLRHHYEQVRRQLKYLQNVYILEVQRYPKYGTVKTETERVLVVCLYRGSELCVCTIT
jgi:hypothetical protein